MARFVRRPIFHAAARSASAKCLPLAPADLALLEGREVALRDLVDELHAAVLRELHEERDVAPVGPREVTTTSAGAFPVAAPCPRSLSE